MEIRKDTKFDIGDIVYVMDNGWPRAGFVNSIKFEYEKDQFGVEHIRFGYLLSYKKKGERFGRPYCEAEAFATLQELRDYVFPPDKLKSK